MHTPTAKTALLALSSLSLAAANASAQGILGQHGELLHAVGDPVPAAAAGVTPAPGATISATNNFDAPTIDQNGTVVYRGRMTGGTVTAQDDRAYFMGRSNGDLQMVVRSGDPAPGLPGFLMCSATGTGPYNVARISPYNEILFFQSALYDSVAGTNPPTNSDTAMFVGPVGGLQLLAREGDPVPFLGTGEVWGGFVAGELQFKCVNSTSAVLFAGQLLGGASTTADDGYIASGLPGNLAFVLREGESFNGTVAVPATGGAQLSFSMQLNEAGQVLHGINFSTTLGTNPATTSNDRALAIWTPGAGQTQIIAREGDAVPGLPFGSYFPIGWTVNQGAATFTRSGKTAILSPLAGFYTGNGILFGGLAGWTVVLVQGDSCPGLVNGETFANVSTGSLTCNDAGEVAFITTLAGPTVTTSDDSSMWVGSAGNLKMIAREGDPVPGFPGFIFQNISGGTANPLLRDGGALLTNIGITNGTSSRNVLLGYTPALGLVTLLDGNEVFTTSLGSGSPGLLSSNQGFNGGDGGQSMLNNQGDFVYRPALGGASTACILKGHLGSFIATPSSVPVAGGVPQSFAIDCGPANANRLYWVLASGMGTRPGFPSPLGPQTVPLNLDPLWTSLSIDAANSPLWINTVGITDANGKGIGPSAFVMPPGYPSFAGATIHHAALIFDLSLTSYFATEPSALKFY